MSKKKRLYQHLQELGKKNWTHRWTPEMFLAHQIFYRNLARPGATARTVDSYVQAIFRTDFS